LKYNSVLKDSVSESKNKILFCFCRAQLSSWPKAKKMALAQPFIQKQILPLPSAAIFLAAGQKDGVSTTIHPKTNSSFAERSYLLGRRPKRWR